MKNIYNDGWELRFIAESPTRNAARLNKQIFTSNTEIYSVVQKLEHLLLDSPCPVTNFMQTKLDSLVLLNE